VHADDQPTGRRRHPAMIVAWASRLLVWAPVTRRFLILALFVAAVLQGALTWLDLSPAARGLWGDEITYLEAARSFARGETPTGLDLWPALYPRLIAGLLGTTPASGDQAWRTPGAVIALQIVLLGIAAAALASFGARALGDERGARIAALAVLCSPSLVAFSHYLWPEILHLALFLGGLALFARPGAVAADRPDRPDRPDRRRRRSAAARAAGAGACWGFAVATKSLLLPLLPVLLVCAHRASRREDGAGVARVKTAMAVAGFLFVSGGLAASLGVRATFANSAWFNAWVGLNDGSRRNLVGEIVGDELARYRASAPTADERSARARGQVVDLIERDGVAHVLARQASRQYFRLLDRRSFFTDMLPGGAIHAHGAGYRIPAEGIPGMASRALAGFAQAFSALLLAAAGVGLVSMPWRERPWLGLVAAFLLYNAAIFLVLHVKTRYRVQFEPFLWLAAAHAWIDRAAVVERLRRSPPRAVAAVVCVGLALLFAFGGDWFDA
jgi:hypothetical protein